MPHLGNILAGPIRTRTENLPIWLQCYGCSMIELILKYVTKSLIYDKLEHQIGAWEFCFSWNIQSKKQGVGRILPKGGGRTQGAKCRHHYGQRSGGCLGAARGLWLHVLGMTSSTSFLFWVLFSLSSFFPSSPPLSLFSFFFGGGGAAAPSAPPPAYAPEGPQKLTP